MPDFTSVLYLGMSHAHDAMRPWRRLTTGRPAALEPSGRAECLAERFARFAGHEAAVLGPSTLHLFWDLFEGLKRDRIVLHVDAGTYPVARWGVERAAAGGVRVVPFPKHDAGTLLANLARESGAGRPVVVADGLCPLTGTVAPLGDYAALSGAFGGLLVVDDTQGVGLFGRHPTAANPYGEGGGGTPAWCNVHGGGLLVVSSLAKAFGAPLAVLAGRGTMIERFKATSRTRIHCSPPSLAAIGAGEAALALNAAEGAARRGRLLGLIRLFRDGLARLGLAAHGGPFPFQTLKRPTGEDAATLHGRLERAGIRTVLHRAAHTGRTLVTFVLNCLQTPPEITLALQALAQCSPQSPSMQRSS